jgi:phosphate transport system permease protein
LSMQEAKLDINMIEMPVLKESKRYARRKIVDAVSEKLIALLTIISASVILFVFIFVAKEAMGVLSASGIKFITTAGFDQQIIKAYLNPLDSKMWTFGALGLILGTVTTTIGALFLAVPMGIGTAIVITELAPVSVRHILQIVVRLLASIPSVIYGLVGLMVVVPFVRNSLITSAMQIQYIKRFQLAGNSMLAGIIVLSIMIAPIIIALSVDAIKAVPDTYKKASLALGLSHWRTIVKVILPAAKSGIFAAAILAIGRAIGEAIALSMVCGGIGNIPNVSDGPVFFLTPVLTLASAIVNKSEMMSVNSIQSALFACGLVLFVTSMVISLGARLVEYLVLRSDGHD